MSSSTSSFLQHYKTIADLSRQMLDEARLQHWSRVIDLSHLYVDAVEHLKNVQDLNLSDREARRDLLTRILADDAEIRQLAAPELQRLGHLLGDMRRQHNVVQAYCSPSYST